MSISRRQFILAASAAGTLGLGAYSYRRGIRIPPFHWEPKAAKPNLEPLRYQSDQAIVLPNSTILQSFWRATEPQPKLSLNSLRALETNIEIHNISPKAILRVEGADYEEQISGTQRNIGVKLSKNKTASLSWSLPVIENGLSFASIGDSGGDLELAWCINRAKQLGADFLLHLGDFNYQTSDYQSAIDHFKNAELPVYVSIGNHDFHDNGGVYGRFLNEIGPLNQAFEIAGNRFVNIDTAAGFLPLSGGHRGKLLKTLKQQPPINTIAFTHCPLTDPDPKSHHDIGSDKERSWFIDQLRSIGASTMLSGHIHINDRRTISGIDHLIVGQGLGHQDLLVGQDHSKIAIGKIDNAGKLELELADLAMPMELHCHPRINTVKESLRGSEHAPLIESIERACLERSKINT